MRTNAIGFSPARNTQNRAKTNRKAAPAFKGKVVIADALIQEAKHHKATMNPAIKIAVDAIKKLGGPTAIAKRTPKNFTYTVGGENKKALADVMLRMPRKDFSKAEQTAATKAEAQFKKLETAVK